MPLILTVPEAVDFDNTYLQERPAQAEHLLNLLRILQDGVAMALIGIGVRQCPSPWVWTARSPHGHRTVAARSRHGHRTVTARSPHGADERASSSHAPRVLVRSPRSHCQGTAPNPPKQSTASAVTAQSPHGTAIAQPRPGNVPGMERAAMDAKKTPGGGIVHCSDAGHGICKLVTKVNRISFSPAGTQQHRKNTTTTHPAPS